MSVVFAHDASADRADAPRCVGNHPKNNSLAKLSSGRRIDDAGGSFASLLAQAQARLGQRVAWGEGEAVGE